MGFLHSLERDLPRYNLNSSHVVVEQVSDDELVARLNMADATFNFMERGKNSQPQWMAPEALSKVG